MTNFGKILVVFVVFASLTFMGFAAVNATGGINWLKERKALVGYEIMETATKGQDITYSVKTRRTGKSVGAETPILAQAIIAARKDMIDTANAENTTLTDAIPKAQDRLKQVQEFIRIDFDAMAKREDDLEKDLEQLRSTIDALAKQGIEKTIKANKIREEAERRREDVFRLRIQLDEIQTDLFQILEQKKRLYDLLYQINGSVEQLKRRKKQLEAAGANINSE